MNHVLSKSSRMRVPRPMICLNSEVDWMFWSITITFTVCVSTPVVRSFEVVTITG